MENNLTVCRLHRQSPFSFVLIRISECIFLTVEIFTFLQAGTGIADLIAMEITKHVCAPNHVPKSFFFKMINLWRKMRRRVIHLALLQRFDGSLCFLSLMWLKPIPYMPQTTLEDRAGPSNSSSINVFSSADSTGKNFFGWSKEENLAFWYWGECWLHLIFYRISSCALNTFFSVAGLLSLAIKGVISCWCICLGRD